LNQTTFQSLILFLLTFKISTVIATYYTESDQFFYIQFFEKSQGIDLLELYSLQASILSSYEPGYTVIIWLSNKLLNRTFFIALSNSLLAITFFNLWIKRGGHWLLIFIILLTNYYFFVCYFSAERLKFAFLFFGIALVFEKKKLKYLIFIILSILTHFQLIILLSAKYISVIKFKKHLINFRNICFVLILVFVFYSLFKNYINYKFNVYFLRYFDFEGLIKIFILLFFCLSYSNSKKEVILSYLPILAAVFLFSGERVIIMAYFLFMYHSISYNKGINSGVILINLYLLIKTIPFITNTIKFGSAF